MTKFGGGSRRVADLAITFTVTFKSPLTFLPFLYFFPFTMIDVFKPFGTGVSFSSDFSFKLKRPEIAIPIGCFSYGYAYAVMFYAMRAQDAFFGSLLSDFAF